MKPQSISTAKLFLIAISLLLFQYATAQNCPQCNLPNPDFVFNDNDIISNQTFQNFVIEINGTVYIDGSCEFIGCHIYLSEQARIELLPGPTELLLHFNEFYNCCDDYMNEYMWDGIYTSDIDNHIFARGNYFLHGENVFVEAFGAEVVLHSNEFDRCYYPFTLRDWSGSPRITFRGNEIHCTTPISAQPIPPQSMTVHGVYISNYVSIGGNDLTIGDPNHSNYLNSFTDIYNAVYVENSDIRLFNNSIVNTINGFYFYNTTLNYYDCVIGGVNANEQNTLLDVFQYGIYVSGRVNLVIERNKIEDKIFYGILLNQVGTNLVEAQVRNNEIIFGTLSNTGIFVSDLRGEISITHNIITTQTVGGIPLSVGKGIAVEMALTAGDIIIENNTIQNNNEGIFARYVTANNIEILSNIIEHTTTASEYGDNGIYVYDCNVNRRVKINHNTMENYENSIYADHVNHSEIIGNNVYISELPGHPYHILIGIWLRNAHNNTISGNHIEMNNGLNTSPGNLYGFKGIVTQNLYNTTHINFNNIYHSTIGLWIYNTVYPSMIFCNIFDYSQFGVSLANAWHGMLNWGAQNYEIGSAGYPANNQWHNELNAQGLRINGGVSPNYEHKWYFKTGAPYTLYPGQYQVLPFVDFEGIQTNEVFDICSQKSFSSKFISLGTLTQQEFSVLSTAKKDTLLMIEFQHLDSLVNYSPSLTSFALPADMIDYENLRNAYLIMARAPWILTSSISATVNKYVAMKNFLSLTNIHRLYVMDTLVMGRYTTQLNTELSSFVPQNQVEQNAADYYTILINFFDNQATLTSADSATLLNIAQQNSFSGGYAVFKARNLLKLQIIDSLIQQNNSSSSINQVLSDGNQQSVKSTNIKVFPNPASQVLFIETDNVIDTDGLFINIFSFTGKLISTFSLDNNTPTMVPIHHLDSGLYYYTITNQSHAIKTGKLIVQK